MPPATDLGNHGLHHLMISTKCVPGQKLYTRHVTVIGRKSSGVGVWFALPSVSAQLQPHSQLLPTQDPSCIVPVSCSPPSLPFWSHRFQHLRCHLFSIPIAPMNRGQQPSSLHQTSSFSHHLVDLQFTHFHPWLRVPQVLVVPLKVLPCRLAKPWQSPCGFPLGRRSVS